MTPSIATTMESRRGRNLGEELIGNWGLTTFCKERNMENGLGLRRGSYSLCFNLDIKIVHEVV